MTHRQAVRTIINIIFELQGYADWSVGINEDGDVDYSCDSLENRFGAITIPVVFWHSDENSDLDLTPDDEMSYLEKFDYWVEEFMLKEPDGFKNIEFSGI